MKFKITEENTEIEVKHQYLTDEEFISVILQPTMSNEWFKYKGQKKIFYDHETGTYCTTSEVVKQIQQGCCEYINDNVDKEFTELMEKYGEVNINGKVFTLKGAWIDIDDYDGNTGDGKDYYSDLNYELLDWSGTNYLATAMDIDDVDFIPQYVDILDDWLAFVKLPRHTDFLHDNLRKLN